MELRPAQRHEARMCYQCIEDARAYHKSLGFEQWHPDYPTQQTIFDDIAQGIGYAFTDDTEETDMTAPYNPDTSTVVFKQPGLIPLPELSALLPTLNRISSWIDSVFAYVSAEAINHAVPIPGYKVVEGRSKRVFTDTKAVVDTAVRNGYTDLYKQQLITLTEFEKLKASDFTAASNPAEDLAVGTVSADTTSPRIIAVGTKKDGSAVIARRGLGMCEY